MQLLTAAPSDQAQAERTKQRQRVSRELPTGETPERQPGAAEERRTPERLHVAPSQVQLEVELTLGQTLLDRVRLRVASDQAGVNGLAASISAKGEPKTQRRQDAREQASSERIVVDGLFDAIEKRLPELGQGELGLNAAHVDRGDRLLHATDDGDLADGHDTWLLLRSGSGR